MALIQATAECPAYWPAIFVIILVSSFMAGLALVAVILVFNLTVYVFFLVLMVILISERSKQFSMLIGKKNPVATLATLILLSYAKLLHIIITALYQVLP